MKNNWKVELVDLYAEGHKECFSPCEFHSDENHINCLFEISPETTAGIKQLIRSEFRTEVVAPRTTDLIEVKPAVIPTSDHHLYHALIKRSRYKYEYLVGSSIPVNGDDIVFIQTINNVKDKYLDNVHAAMRDIVSNEPRCGVTFNNNTFVFKPTATVSFEKIVRIYRHAQD